jgi:cell wall-associated NlpC family hydrolase
MDSARNIPASVMQQLMRNAELNEQGLAKIDDLLGQLLHNIGTLWFFDLRHERDFYASTTQVSYTTLPSEVIATSDVTVSFFLGIPRRVREGSMTVDADRDTVAVAPFSGDSTRRKNFMVLAGMTGSAWEHLVFENFFDLEGASSMKLLRLANDQRVPIHVIDQRNIAQVLPLLRLSAEDVADIVNGVNSGGKAIVSETEIQLDKYRGVGLVIIDQISGGGLYLISGGLSGGSACGIPADPDKECAVNEWKEKVASRASVANAARSAIVRWAISMVGTPYSMGCRDPRYPPTYWCKQENDDGSPKDPNGIDCSGLAAYAYSRVGYPLKGSNGEDLNAAGQYAIVPNHPAPPSARQADLIFWEDTYKPGISHVGILWHKVSGQPIGWIAAQDQMVGIYFDKEYWNERFVGYGSVFNY